MLAYLIGFLGDFDLAEDAAQEAFAVAAERWPQNGRPDNPGAWLMTTARHRAIDRLRRERTLAAKTLLLDVPESMEDEIEDPGEIADERLELLFTCCHPALAIEAQVSLTLRTVAGLGTDEIARAFIVSPETMKRRLSRAKAKIKVAGIPFTAPPEHLVAERLAAVLAVVYLIFNEGYGGRIDLAGEAIRLGGLLAELMPDESEIHGLLALMRLHDSRRRARYSPAGELVLLAEQDRSLWDHGQIDAGRAALTCALGLPGRGSYLLQAMIAAEQVPEQPDWKRIALLYEELGRLTGSAVVALNRAVAVAQAGAPEDGLSIVESLGSLADYPYLHSTRAELLRRVGREHEAAAAYRLALGLATAEPERRFLRRRLAEF